MATEDSIRALYTSCVGGSQEFGISHLQKVLKSIGVEELSQTDMEAMMESLDYDGDGVVSEDDFLVVMSDYMKKIPAMSRGASVSSMDDEHVRGPNGSILHCSADEEASLRPLQATITDLVAHAATDSHVVDSIMAAVEEHLENRFRAREDILGREGHLYEQELKRNEMLLRENTLLTEEYGRLEAELAQLPVLQRKLTDAAAETEKLHQQHDAALQDVQRLLEVESRLRREIQTQRDAAQQQQRTAVVDADAAEKLRRMQADRDEIAGEYTAAQRDRSVLAADCAALTEEIRALRQLVPVHHELQEEVLRLRVVVDELRGSVAARDETIHRLQAEGNSGGSSIFNEIEELVKNQMSHDRGSALPPLSAAIRQMIPDATLGDSAFASSFEPSPDKPAHSRAIPSTTSSTSASLPASALPSALPSSRPSTFALIPAQGPPSAPAPRPSADDSWSPVDDDERFDAAIDDVAAAAYAREVGVASPSADDSMMVVGRTELAAVVEPGRLDECLRLFAASTQHLAGHKIATPAGAAVMGCRQLQQLKATLTDLIRARSQKLMEALQERDRLAHEIEVKQAIIVPVIGLVRAGDIASPRVLPADHAVTPPGTPSGVSPTPRPLSRLARLWSGARPRSLLRRPADGTEVQV